MHELIVVAVASFFAFVISYLSNWLWRIKGEKAVFSNRLQFEKEFDIYQRLWAQLVDVLQGLEAPAGSERREKCSADLAAAGDTVFKFSPFYAGAVHAGAKKALAAAAALQTAGHAAPDQLAALRRQMDQVSTAIRERIWPAP